VYEPTYESLRTHRVPPWFEDAKLGIFIHWGLYSVPGWAPREEDVQLAEGESRWAAHPFAELYLNAMRIAGSPTQRYHRATYGADFGYADFAPIFNRETRKWDPDAWASLFAEIGARYVVLTAKHCENFPLWPAARTAPGRPGYHAERDLVGDLATATRSHGLRFGLYYNSGVDWERCPEPFTGPSWLGLYDTMPQTPEYVDYVRGHWTELIDRYQPSLMWNDIGFPHDPDLPTLMAHYYNTVADGVINDRFVQDYPTEPHKFYTGSRHSDFTTPEYASYDTVQEKKWEGCRGIGRSFGFNRNEQESDYLSVAELIWLLADTVSKNGNLLLNIGPMADGTIPEPQRRRLRGLGEWLRANGEAIFATRPWRTAEGLTERGAAVRFTQKADRVYAIIAEARPDDRLRVDGLAGGVTAQVLASGAQLATDREQVDLPVAAGPAEEPVVVELAR
jgi:alpha-L-fucosidase